MIADTVAALFAGFFGAIGVGGGAVLMLYLTLILSMPQTQAQTLNLVFFVPCALIGILFHAKNKLLDIKKALTLILFALPGVAIGYFLHLKLHDEILRKLFGVFILILAVQQLRGIKKERSRNAP